MLKRYLLFIMMCLAGQAQTVNAETKGGGDDAKSLSGISIVGNKEAPKSLYSVPWRSSELGMETDLNSSLLNEGLHPVDKDVFQRELDFYEISKGN